MAIQVQRRLFTAEQFEAMARAGILAEDDRVELLEGEIVEMAPIGSSHASTVVRLTHLLQPLMSRRVLVSVQNPVRLGERSEPQPDITLLRPRADFYSSQHPGPTDVMLLIEVADTSAAFERQVKLPLYARAGIREVWLVDLAAQRVEVYREPSLQGYMQASVQGRGGVLTPSAFPDSALRVNDVLG